MKKGTLMDEAALVKKAVQVLMRERGPVEAFRFVSMPSAKRMESVKRHRAWQKKLDAKEFFNQVFHSK